MVVKILAKPIRFGEDKLRRILSRAESREGATERKRLRSILFPL